MSAAVTTLDDKITDLTEFFEDNILLRAPDNAKCLGCRKPVGGGLALGRKGRPDAPFTAYYHGLACAGHFNIPQSLVSFLPIIQQGVPLEICGLFLMKAGLELVTSNTFKTKFKNAFTAYEKDLTEHAKLPLTLDAALAAQFRALDVSGVGPAPAIEGAPANAAGNAGPVAGTSAAGAAANAGEDEEMMVEDDKEEEKSGSSDGTTTESDSNEEEEGGKGKGKATLGKRQRGGTNSSLATSVASTSSKGSKASKPSKAASAASAKKAKTSTAAAAAGGKKPKNAKKN